MLKVAGQGLTYLASFAVISPRHTNKSGGLKSFNERVPISHRGTEGVACNIMDTSLADGVVRGAFC